MPGMRSPAPAAFLRRQWRAKRAILRTARTVHERTGKGVLSQLREITRLRFGPGRLYAPDYFMYGVYDDRRYSRAGKREVLSWHPARIADALNDPGSRALCDDKLLFHALLRGLGAPSPPVYAAYDPGGRSFGETPVLTTPGQVAAFLRDGMAYPFFAKEITGGYGAGASAVSALDAAQDRVLLSTGESLPVDAYIERYVTASDGYLFQQPVRQHPHIDRITGGRVGTLRLVVLRGDDGPRLFRTVWRIPVGSNLTDNFLHGTRGNLVAHVDRETGVVGAVVQVLESGSGAAGGLRLGRELEVHPDTGERITGERVPHWPEIVSACLQAGAVFPRLRYQSWDVAIGPEGPLLLELNYRGDFGLAQIPGTPGLFDAEFRAFWTRYRQSP